MSGKGTPVASSPSVTQRARTLRRRMSRIMSRLRMTRMMCRLVRPDIAVFHEFKRPPYGGGNQFLVALRGEFRRRGFRVGANVIGKTTRACLFNSFNFDVDELRDMRQPGCIMVHRVDGPLASYRGCDDGTDALVWRINQHCADATVLQLRYSLEAYRALGLQLKAPVTIMNSVDPRLFYPPAAPRTLRERKVRLIATSWSSNPNKGAAVHKWLEEHLDWSRFEYTFVGNSPVAFERIRTVAPLPSAELGEMLRTHDVYIAASVHDPCSNALLEAQACGLPAIYARSGGHPEIVGDAGLGFDSAEEIPDLLARLIVEYEARRSCIRTPRLSDVADQYLRVMGLGQTTTTTPEVGCEVSEP